MPRFGGVAWRAGGVHPIAMHPVAPCPPAASGRRWMDTAGAEARAGYWQVAGLRNTRPARAPVCSSSRKITSPLHTVAK